METIIFIQYLNKVCGKHMWIISNIEMLNEVTGRYMGIISINKILKLG